MTEQPNLFNKTRWLERTSSVNTTVKVKLEPLEGQRVRVLEAYRIRGNHKTLIPDLLSEFPFEQMNAGQSFEEFFR